MFTYGQLMRKVDGMINQKNEDYKTNLENIRLHAFWIVQSKTKRKLKLSDFMVFEWEKKQKKDAPLSPEKVDNIIEKLKGRPTKQVRIETLLNNG